MYLLGSFTTQQTNLFFFQLQKERIHDVVAYMDGLLQAYWMYMLCTFYAMLRCINGTCGRLSKEEGVLLFVNVNCKVSRNCLKAV